MNTRIEPQQRRSRDKRDRVLAAAAALLQEVPFDEIGTRLIAERAEVSVGSLYRFFPDKEAIFLALSESWLDKVIALMDGLVAAPPATLGAFVDSVVDTFAAFFRDEPGYRQVSLGSQTLLVAPGASARNDADLAERLRRTVTGHYGRPDDAELTPRLLLAIHVTECLLNRAFRTDPAGDPFVLSELKGLLRAYLGA
ncbi:TetR family transcriptional regulator [Dactylosporangium salmoneum]|uniref:TetR family transcriptional regulator n=1 Tax=Dactylosporangium salmoneum TaxID=53361 RepID=A0ABN3GYB9_9ACTN